MGVTYKIKPEIREFILNQARSNPKLGCRAITCLVQEQFRASVSKSSIATLLKSEGLNKSIGRPAIHRRYKRRQKEPAPISQEIPLLAVQNSTLLIPQSETKHPLNVIVSKPLQAVSGFPRHCEEPPLLSCFRKKARRGDDEAISEIASLVPPLAGLARNDEGTGMGLINQAPTETSQHAVGAQFTQPILSASTNREWAGFIAPLSAPDQVVGHWFLKAADLCLGGGVSGGLEEVLTIKVILADNSFFFLDANFQSIWTTPRIPIYFSGTIYRVREYLNRTFLYDTRPIILQAPPGFGGPAAIFFDFVASCQAENKTKFIQKIELHSPKNELLETFPTVLPKPRPFIMGLWPWQSEKVRVVEPAELFKAFYFELTQENFLLGEGQKLFQNLDLKEQVSLRSISLKRSKDDLISIITNIPKGEFTAERIAFLYLERWPHLEEGYGDFLEKTSAGVIASPAVRQGEAISEIASLVPPLAGLARNDEERDVRNDEEEGGIKLSGFCQRYFFPTSYQTADFPLLKERFYELKGTTEIQIGHFIVKFNVQSEYLYRNELIYACQRVNEREIRLADGKRVFFAVGAHS